MRSVEEQLQTVIDTAVAPEPIRVALTDASGLRCACLLYTSDAADE